MAGWSHDNLGGDMRQYGWGAAVVGLLAYSAWTQPVAAEGMDPGMAISKLGRGAVNTVTGWVEIPKRVQETSAESGAAAGFTWGLLRGLGYGIVRTAAGLYEIISFPFPAPPDYAPVMEPEYVFSEPRPTG